MRNLLILKQAWARDKQKDPRGLPHQWRPQGMAFEEECAGVLVSVVGGCHNGAETSSICSAA